ncbi:MAG: MarR family transcriptional regulator [Ruminococcaceae bacterium]|nr:MarR family transcriptional regulator [Oscillospiraceae bacterium]
MIQRFEQFSYSISSIYRLILKLEKEEMEKCGYRGSYALYLSIMSRYPGGITATRLGELCDRDKAGISRIINEMEEKGLVHRECHKDNFYRAKLVLTAEGRKAASFVKQRAVIAVSAASQGLSEEDRRTLYAALYIIEENLKKISDNGISDT